MLQLFTNRRFLLIALIFLLITWVMFVSSQRSSGEGKAEYFFNTAMAPLEQLFNNLGKVVSDSWETITKLAKLKTENERLKKEINDLKAAQLGLNVLKSENERLRSALQFKSSQPHELVPAEIIATNPSNWHQTVMINKGKNYGLRRNMAVITSQGVVGRIGEVRATTAEIILVTDPREGNFIGGVVARTRNVVIVNGGGMFRGECTIKPALESYFINLKQGDLIVTSETSEVFPRGIPIGKIERVNKSANNLVNKATLKPTVNLGKLQLIYVIKTKKDSPVAGGSTNARSNS